MNFDGGDYSFDNALIDARRMSYPYGMTVNDAARWDWDHSKKYDKPPTPAPHDPGDDEGARRFHAILAELGTLHDTKQRDYGRPGDPFSNVRASSEWGVDPWVGVMIRLNDKVRRLQRAAAGGTLANEGVVDSLNDIAVYAVIARVLYETRHDG